MWECEVWQAGGPKIVWYICFSWSLSRICFYTSLPWSRINFEKSKWNFWLCCPSIENKDFESRYSYILSRGFMNVWLAECQVDLLKIFIISLSANIFIIKSNIIIAFALVFDFWKKYFCCLRLMCHVCFAVKLPFWLKTIKMPVQKNQHFLS